MTKKNAASQMRKLVKLYQESGQSRKEFAKLHGLKQGKLQYWISKLLNPDQLAPRVTPKKDFVAIEVTPEQETRSILIRLKSGVEIEIPL